ncbi:hypothetical protein [Amycolatopsis lexingtonensis]|uniref:hypothetical protein n=1 Tax=Amycolatopsis lexingtonensis TaxID=218822 RepID=UPI003F6F2A23
MADAVTKTVASSVEYNKVTANIRDLDARLGPVVSTATADSRISTLETNMGSRGVRDQVYAEIQNLRNVTLNSTSGNVALSNMLGTGFGTTTDGTAGTATAQVGNLRSRVVALESATGTGTAPGGEYRGTSLPMATGANKLSFSTAIKAASGITWNGSNQFTVVTAGVYGFYVGGAMGFVSTASWGLAVHDASGWPAQAYTLFSQPLFATGQTNSFSSGQKWLDVGQTICAYAYNNESTARTLAGAEFRVWRIS